MFSAFPRSDSLFSSDQKLMLRVRFEEFDPEYANPDAPEIIHANFEAALHDIAEMEILEPEHSFDFPPPDQLMRLLQHVHSYLCHFPQPDLSSRLLMAFLSDIVNRLSECQALVTAICAICMKVSLLPMTEETSSIVPSALRIFQMGIDRLKETCILIFRNSIIDKSTESLIYDLEIPAMILNEVRTTASDRVRICGIDFLGVVAFIAFHDDESVTSKRIELEFFQSSLAIAMQHLHDPFTRQCLRLLECLLYNPDIVVVALAKNVLEVVVAQCHLFCEPASLESFFEIVRYLVKLGNCPVSSEFFAEFCGLAKLGCELSIVKLFQLLDHLNERFWLQLWESGVVECVVAVLPGFGVQMAQGACCWMMDLMPRATVEMRRAIGSPELVRLAVENLGCQAPEVVQRIGSGLAVVLNDDPEFWGPIFEDCECEQCLQDLIDGLEDSDDIASLTEIRDILIPGTV
jgi:hypothetical protein